MPRYILDFTARCAMTVKAKNMAEAVALLRERFPECSTVAVLDSTDCLIPDTMMEATIDEEEDCIICTRDDSEDDPEDRTLPGDDA